MKKIALMSMLPFALAQVSANAQSYQGHPNIYQPTQPQQQTEYITVPVRKVTPVVVEQEQIQDVCDNRPQRVEKSGLGPLAGAVIGGVVGNQVGKGTGRALATGAGIIGGAIIGDKLEENTARANSMGECTKRSTWTQKLVGYDVEYEYKGSTYQVTTKKYPDKMLTLQVTTSVSVLSQD